MFQSLIQLAIQIVSLIKGKPKIMDVLSFLFTHLPTLISNLVSSGQYTTKEKIDDALKAFDSATGTEPGAIAPFAGIPKDKQEELFQHVEEIARIVLYHECKIDGYFE